MTVDEFYTLLQLLLMILGFISLTLVFVYLAYEKT
jgi:hypothetical protein